jgi:hypothetical protein
MKHMLCWQVIALLCAVRLGAMDAENFYKAVALKKKGWAPFAKTSSPWLGFLKLPRTQSKQ